jgi:hypothetical protein
MPLTVVPAVLAVVRIAGRAPADPMPARVRDMATANGPPVAA